jgi:tetratricopeptide (TPR) repeat protein
MRLSAIKCQSKEYDEAVTLAERAMRLSPYPPAWFFGDLGRNYREAGRYDDAIKAYHQLLKRSRQGETDPLLPHLCLAVTYIYLDQETEAKNHANEVLKIWPNPSLNIIRKGLKFKDASRNSRFVDAFRKALTLAGWEAKE